MKRSVVVLIGCMLSALFLPASSRPGDVNELNAAIQQKGAKWTAKENPLSNNPVEGSVEPHGHSPWHPASRPSGATSRPSTDAFTPSRQEPGWPSAAGGKWASLLQDTEHSTLSANPTFYIPMALPSSFDWTRNGGNYVTSVKSQGSCAACGIFTIIAAMESKYLITHDLPWIDLNLSEQIILSCPGVTNCSGGGSLPQILNVFKSSGTYLERCYPFAAPSSRYDLPVP